MYNAKDSKEVCNFSIIIKSFDAVIGGEKYDKNLILGYHSSESSLRLLLDYDEIQIKEGDYIHMDYILLPFGDYNVESDKSVLNVREDTCINPLKVTADFGQAEEVYPVPTVSASKDGDFYKSIFTLSGARDSYTVRVTGFESPDAVTVYEKIDGQWAEYKLSSSIHDYDGYGVYYNNGKYDFTFIADMGKETDNTRTFAVVGK